MDIHQMSVNYVREHDRLLVRVNTAAREEFRLWFTQRLLKGLLPPLHRVAADLEASRTLLADASDTSKQMLSEFKREESLRQSDFETPYDAGAATWPLGQEPLLVTEVSLTPRGSGKLEIAFDERLPDAPPRGFTMALQPQLLHGLLHLIIVAAKVAEWPLALVAAPQTARVAVAEPDAGEKRPKYLN